MRSKLLVLLTVLALVLGTFTSALAQEPEIFCGDLSAEDCAILQESKAAMQDVVQYTAQSSFDAALVGIPGLPADPTEVSVSVGGMFSMDEAAKAAAQSLAGLTQEEQAQLLAESPETLLDLFAGWDFDVSMGVAMTPELAAALSVQAGLELPDTLSIQAKLVDGVLYWDASEVAAVLPTVAAGWVGLPLVDMLSALAEQGAFEQMADPAALAEAGMSGTAMTGLGAAQFAQAYAALFEPFLTVERGEDVELDGQAGAAFVTTFDAVGFFGSPEFQQVVIDLANAGAFEGTGLTAADVEQNIGMLGMMAPMLFDGITATAMQVIGLDDLYQYDYQSEISWDLAGLVQMAATSGQLPAELQPTGDNVSVSLSTIISNGDMATEQTEAIEAPADAAMIPLESLLAAPAQ